MGVELCPPFRVFFSSLFETGYFSTITLIITRRREAERRVIVAGRHKLVRNAPLGEATSTKLNHYTISNPLGTTPDQAIDNF